MSSQTRLEIRCTGRRINRFDNQPYGPPCGSVFTSAAAYRSRPDWIERARVAGWRVSPLQQDETVTAFCPACLTSKDTPQAATMQEELPLMTLTDNEKMLVELRAAIQVDDEKLEFERRHITGKIRERLTAASPWPWYLHKNIDGSIRVHRTGCVSYSRIASMLRSGGRPAEDGELIAHAPADLAYLLDEVERLRAERDVLLEHATPQAQTAYWTQRAEDRGREIAARRETRKPRR